MTFYFKPPRGNIPLHKLEECILERVRYLSYVETLDDISSCEDGFKFEYLTDGSALDRTGHFMLRMISLRQHSLKDFILRRETLLFEKRLKCSNVVQVKGELRTALRHVREILGGDSPILKYKVFLINFLEVCSNMMSEGFVSHSFHPDHSDKCDLLHIKVPFNLCLSFISSRTVDLAGGFAFIPCGRWAQLLASLFFEHMKQGLEQLYSSVSFNLAWLDDRVKLIAKTLRSIFEKQNAPSKSLSYDLTCQNVDFESPYFPPCMITLHQTLRTRHRLSHNSRFYYSLFLKDIGMPLVESVEFWSKEYRQPHTNCASCSHSWQKDGRRYIYSIRHMYGLEGSRREYLSHSCNQLQSLSLGPAAEGGCPFVHFDAKSLISVLDKRVTSNEKVLEAIINVSDRSPSQGCHLYLNMLQKLLTGDATEKPKKQNTINFKKPREFYLGLTSLLNLHKHS